MSSSVKAGPYISTCNHKEVYAKSFKYSLRDLWLEHESTKEGRSINQGMFYSTVVEIA